MTKLTAEQKEEENAVACLPPTDMLYMSYEGVSMTGCSAKILHVTQKNDTNQDNDNGNNKDATATTSGGKDVTVYLDRTVFHAQGGGQPTDRGTLTVVASSDNGNDGGDGAAITTKTVVHVSKVVQDRETGVASHTGRLDDESDGTLLRAGEAVQACVDEDLRRELSECHTAGHVVDSAMERCGKLWKPTRAYHFLQGPYVEYAGSVPPEEREGFLKDLQTAFCQLVDEKIDTKIELMTKEQADARCNRKAQNFDMDVFADKRTNQIRVVTVAGFSCPCGGTHVLNTADLKKRGWNVTGLKSKKGVVRVKYGQNAV